MIRIDKNLENRVCQGDLIRDVEFIEYAEIISGEIEISKIIFPVVIVLTQDCDLEQDFNNRLKNEQKDSANQDKYLISTLVAPVYNIEQFYDGDHLSELGLKMQTISKKEKKTDNRFLRQNQNPRYHYLEFPDDFPLPNSVIDFKHYFTTNLQYLRRIKPTHFIGKVSELYRESVSHRFASFLARIGLPSI